MDGILHYYFKMQRIEKDISLKNVSEISLIDSTEVRKFESNEHELSDSQIIRLFNTIGIDFRKLIKEYNAYEKEISKILTKIVYLDSSFKNDFDKLQREMKKQHGKPHYYVFLALQIMVCHREDSVLHKTKEIVESYYDYLSIQFKQTFLIGCGQNKEDHNLLDEAKEFYYDAIDFQCKTTLTAMAENYISTIYHKQMNLGKAYKFCLLARIHFKEDNNLSGAILAKIYEGMILYKMNCFSESERISKEFLEETKFNNLVNILPTFINNLIMCYLFKKDYKNMLLQCGSLVRTGAAIPDVYFYKVWAYYNIHEYEAAEFVIECARKDIPDNLYNMTLIDMIEALMHNREDTEVKLLHALDVITEHSARNMIYFVLDVITDYYYSQNNFEQACKYFKIKRSYQEVTL